MKTKDEIKKMQERIELLKAKLHPETRGDLSHLTDDELERMSRDMFGFFYIGVEAGKEHPISPQTQEELVKLICPHCIHFNEQCESGGIDKPNECSRFMPTPESWERHANSLRRQEKK